MWVTISCTEEAPVCMRFSWRCGRQISKSPFGVVDLQHAPFLLCCPEFFGTHITAMPFSSKFCIAKKKCASAREKNITNALSAAGGLRLSVLNPHGFLGFPHQRMPGPTFVFLWCAPCSPRQPALHSRRGTCRVLSRELFDSSLGLTVDTEVDTKW